MEEKSLKEASSLILKLSHFSSTTLSYYNSSLKVLKQEKNLV